MARLWACGIGLLVMASAAIGAPDGAVETPAAKAAVAAPSVILRDPFWPVNYLPQAEGRAAKGADEDADDVLQFSGLTPQEQALVKARFRVAGILQQGHQRIAIINRQVVRAGDILTIQLDGHPYDFIIRSLEEKRIQLEPTEKKMESKPDA